MSDGTASSPMISWSAYVEHDPDILPTNLYWLYYDTARQTDQLDQLWQWIQQLSESPDAAPAAAAATHTSKHLFTTKLFGKICKGPAAARKLVQQAWAR